MRSAPSRATEHDVVGRGHTSWWPKDRHSGIRLDDENIVRR
ncbi:hypothetical protein WB401_12890 [Streptomyces brasiliscabiei]|uniref:Uncharacterized protein n=1 Tax=Streptomyces brasiliscabiei TaxID=2736302 RepID=A0ABU8GNJ4_9ACTN